MKQMAKTSSALCGCSGDGTFTYSNTVAQKQPHYHHDYWSDGTRADVTAEHISRALKLAAIELQYPTNKGIPVSRINTHSLRSGGANALSLSGYSDTQIQKMGRWRGATFKEYIREELACYARNMSRDMKQKFKFGKIAGNVFTEIPHTQLYLIEPNK